MVFFMVHRNNELSVSVISETQLVSCGDESITKGMTVKVKEKDYLYEATVLNVFGKWI